MAEYNLEEWLRAWGLDDLYPELTDQGFEVATDLTGLTADDIASLNLPDNGCARLMQALGITQTAGGSGAAAAATAQQSVAATAGAGARNEVYEWLYAWRLHDAYYPMANAGITSLTDISALKAGDLDKIDFPAEWMRSRLSEILSLGTSSKPAAGASESKTTEETAADAGQGSPGLRGTIGALTRKMSGWLGIASEPADISAAAGQVVSAELGGPAPDACPLPLPPPDFLVSESSDYIDVNALQGLQEASFADDD